MRFSYLVYAAAPEPRPHGLARVISHRIKEKGRTRYFACSDAGALDYQLNWNDRFDSGEPVRSYRFSYQLLPSTPAEDRTPEAKPGLRP